jgi:hypothetical protein
MRRRLTAGAVAAAALAAAVLAPAGAAAAAPRVSQLVVLRDGRAVQRDVSTAAATVRVGKRHCSVPPRTALAALARSRIGALTLRDYGACSRRAADAAGLYVSAIRGERARGRDGWVYKVGGRLASAGAADPGGPFGNGRLHNGVRITWFYCRLSGRGCQRTLVVRAAAAGGGVVTVTVRALDDGGHGQPAAGATVHAGAATATTAADGRATLQLAPGPARVFAAKRGAVRSFEEAVDVR